MSDLLPTKTDPITDAERITIAQLLAQSISVPEIAAQLRRSPERIYATCAEAQQVLQSSALEAALDWRTASRMAAIKGDHRPAKDLLQALKVVEPEAPSGKGQGPQVVVQLGFALPGLPSPVALPPVKGEEA